MKSSNQNSKGTAGCAGLILIIVFGFFIKTCSSSEKSNDSIYSSPTTFPIADTTEISETNNSLTPSNKRNNKVKSYSVQIKKKKSKKRASGGGRVLIRGPRGGCYYINENGNKVYVDRSLCN